MGDAAPCGCACCEAPGSSRVTCSWKPKDSLCVALATCPKYERYPEWSVPSSRSSCGTLTNVRSDTRKNHCTAAQEEVEVRRRWWWWRWRRRQRGPSRIAAAGECGRLMILPTASMCDIGRYGRFFHASPAAK